MKFIVRYWSSRLPVEYRGTEAQPRWLDYSVHPASKLGLHNALLAVHDRLEILEAHGGAFGCALFVEEGGSVEQLTQAAANSLFARLPRGEVKWLDIGRCLLPARPAAAPSSELGEAPRAAQQLPLFAHTHTPYDDLDEETPHALDIDI